MPAKVNGAATERLAVIVAIGGIRVITGNDTLVKGTTPMPAGFTEGAVA